MLSIIRWVSKGMVAESSDPFLHALTAGKPTIITNAEGGRTTPSVVAFTKTGDRLVGQVGACCASPLATSVMIGLGMSLHHQPALALFHLWQRDHTHAAARPHSNAQRAK